MTRLTTSAPTPEAIADTLSMLASIVADDDDTPDGWVSVQHLHLLIRDDEARPAIVDHIRALRAADGIPSDASDEALSRVIARCRVKHTAGGPELLPASGA